MGRFWVWHQINHLLICFRTVFLFNMLTNQPTRDSNILDLVLKTERRRWLQSMWTLQPVITIYMISDDNIAGSIINTRCGPFISNNKTTTVQINQSNWWIMLSTLRDGSFSLKRGLRFRCSNQWPLNKSPWT